MFLSLWIELPNLSPWVWSKREGSAWMASNLLKSTQPKHLDLSILSFLVKLVWVRASVYWLFCKTLKNSMLSFYTNQLIIYLSMKKYFLIKKKLYKNLILCVIVFLRSSTTLAFAVWIIPICSFSCDHNIILFFTYVNVFIFLSFFSICHMSTELSEINLFLS